MVYLLVMPGAETYPKWTTGVKLSDQRSELPKSFKKDLLPLEGED
jgi:hypothetical protein